LDRNFVPGSTKDVDQGTCLTWQKHNDHPPLNKRDWSTEPEIN